MKILALVALGEWLSMEAENIEALPLIRRVREFAQLTGAEVHLSHQVFDATLDTRAPINGGSAADQVREELVQKERQCLEMLLESFKRVGVPATSSVRFARVNANTILEEISAESPDLVFKLSRDHNFVLGLFSNLDWELIRRSPVPIWFVKKELPVIESVVGAIDLSEVGVDQAGETPLDVEVLVKAKDIAQSLKAGLSIVHAYESSGYTHLVHGGIATDPVLAVSPKTARLLSESHRVHEAQLKQQHREQLKRLASQFGLSENCIVMKQGMPAEAIADVAKEQLAGLIVMGARNMQRWERVFSRQNAEPVLSDANSDVLFVTEGYLETALNQPGEQVSGSSAGY